MAILQGLLYIYIHSKTRLSENQIPRVYEPKSPVDPTNPMNPISPVTPKNRKNPIKLQALSNL